MNHCGDCTMCCKLLCVPEIKKMPSKWCPHCHIGKGCRVYETRPTSCREFECLWLLSQRQAGAEMPMALRPDHCKFVIAPITNENYITVQVDPGYRDAWKHPVALAILECMARRFRIVIGWGPGRDKVLLRYDAARDVVLRQEIQISEPDENGMQWGKA